MECKGKCQYGPLSNHSATATDLERLNQVAHSLTIVFVCLQCVADGANFPTSFESASIAECAVAVLSDPRPLFMAGGTQTKKEEPLVSHFQFSSSLCP